LEAFNNDTGTITLLMGGGAPLSTPTLQGVAAFVSNFPIMRVCDASRVALINEVSR